MFFSYINLSNLYQYVLQIVIVILMQVSLQVRINRQKINNQIWNLKG